MRSQFLRGVMLLLGFVVCVSPAFAGDRPYQTTVVEPVDGYDSVVFTDVNNANLVCGYMTTTTDGKKVGRPFVYKNENFLWLPLPDMKDRRLSSKRIVRPVAISDRGGVVGNIVRSESRQAVYWGADGTPVKLGTLGGHSSRARDLNNHGVVVGSSLTDDHERRGFVWRRDAPEGERMRGLGYLKVTNADDRPRESRALTINDNGRIAGSAVKHPPPGVILDHTTKAVEWRKGKIREFIPDWQSREVWPVKVVTLLDSGQALCHVQFNLTDYSGSSGCIKTGDRLVQIEEGHTFLDMNDKLQAIGRSASTDVLYRPRHGAQHVHKLVRGFSSGSIALAGGSILHLRAINNRTVMVGGPYKGKGVIVHPPDEVNDGRLVERDVELSLKNSEPAIEEPPKSESSDDQEQSDEELISDLISSTTEE